MANLKNITELPVAESAEGLNLIVNDNGAAKQIAASAVGAQADFAITDETNPGFIKNKPEAVQADWTETNESNPAYIKNKPHRELMYEWNFEADPNPDNCVWEIIENVDDDLSWLTTLSEDTGWELEVSQYGYYNVYDEDTDTDTEIVVPNVYTIVRINENYSGVRFQNDCNMQAESWARNPVDLDNFEIGYYENYATASVFNKLSFSEDTGLSPTAQGGVLGCSVNGGGPLKSIKIYKVYR